MNVHMVAALRWCVFGLFLTGMLTKHCLPGAPEDSVENVRSMFSGFGVQVWGVELSTFFWSRNAVKTVASEDNPYYKLKPSIHMNQPMVSLALQGKGSPLQSRYPRPKNST